MITQEPPNKLKHKMPKAQVQTVEQIDFGKLEIPDYQRPYRWEIGDVKKIIDDIMEAKRCKTRNYRLGTLVLYSNEGSEEETKKNSYQPEIKEEQSRTKYELVDGQQRIVTISILLKICTENLTRNDERQKLQVKFSDKVSQYHIAENYTYIINRSDIDTIRSSEFINYVKNNCEFVVVNLYDIDEAFQFFDSQNARGKKLSPCDILKAYHLAEIPKLSSEDENNVKLWEKMGIDEREELFDLLACIKEWTYGNNCQNITNENMEIFYGIDEEKYNTYPCYQPFAVYSKVAKLMPLAASYQILAPFVKGSMFFSMYKYYQNLFSQIKKGAYGMPDDKNWKESKEYAMLYKKGVCKWYRSGDTHMRKLFCAMVFLEINRFGEREIDNIAKNIFKYCFSIRLKWSKIRWGKVEEYALNREGMFMKIARSEDIRDIIAFHVSIPENQLNDTWDNKVTTLVK